MGFQFVHQFSDFCTTGREKRVSFIPVTIKNPKTNHLAYKWLQYISTASLGLGLLMQVQVANADRGKALFSQCARCHGNRGEGRQEISAPAIAGMPEWYVASQLKKFKEDIRGNHAKDVSGLKMRPMAKMLHKSKGDIEAVAKYVSGLKMTTPSQTITGGNTAAGATLYQSCAACHGDKGEGKQSLSAPPLVGQSDWYLMTQLYNFKNGLRGTGKDLTGASMASMVNVLADEKAMRDALAYIYTLQ